MNTVIKINGLDVEFSDKVPTRPGVYWVKPKDKYPITHPRLCTVLTHCGRMYEDCGELDPCGIPQGVLWSTSPLVPAVEVERAYDEEAEDMRSKDINRNWAGSRACAVTEGGE